MRCIVSTIELSQAGRFIGAAARPTFVAILEDHDIVYVDLPDWTGPQENFPGWSPLARIAVVDQGLMSETDARRAKFAAGIRPEEPQAFFR